MTRIGVGGLINMDKLKKANAILTDIQLFQYHSNCLISESKDAGLHSAAWYVSCYVEFTYSPEFQLLMICSFLHHYNRSQKLISFLINPDRSFVLKNCH